MTRPKVPRIFEVFAVLSCNYATVQDMVCVICGALYEPLGMGRPRTTCSDVCRLTQTRARWERNKRYKPVPERSRSCVVCGMEFPARGKVIVCSDDCRLLRRRQVVNRWRRELSDDARATVNRRNRLNRYGLTPDGWDALLASQGGLCAACGSSDSGRYWHTDHCHASGRVRGILCHGCNTALGLLRDSRERLAALDAYLVRAA